MAAPNYQAIGAFQNGGAVQLTVPWPASHAVDDIGILVISSAGTIAPLTTASGFVEIPNSPLVGTGLNLGVYWCRATSTSMASVVTGTAVNNISASILTFRGCITTGNPWGVVSSSAKPTTSTATSITGATTLVPETLIVYAAARGSDAGATQYSAQADSTLVSITERLDNGTTTGNGGGLGVWTGEKTTAGAFGPMTATLATTSDELYLAVALKPPTPAGTVDLVVATGTDDGYDVNGNALNNTPGFVSAGRDSGFVFESWIRFVNVAIPQGATITSAVLALQAETSLGTVTNVRSAVFAEAVDNAAIPTTHADFVAKARTTAKVDFDPAVWVVNTTYNLPDIASVIQEVVSRAGWASGNALQLLWEDDGTSGDHWVGGASFDHATRQEPRLVVTFTTVTNLTGTVAVTQAAQTSTASALETLTATSAQTQAAQTSTASGSVANPVTGTIAQTQANQTSTASGLETITGTSANVQANQTSTASGSVGAAPITGTATPTQADQTSTASGFSALNLTGTLAVTQAAQTSTAAAQETFTGTSANVQDDQTSTATATFGYGGTVNVTQDNQTSTAAGIAAVAITGTLAEVQDDQFSTATANGGTVTFWVPQPAGYTPAPVSHTKAPVGFVKVGPGDTPPNW